ncbi:MAG: hypothetical protein E6923_17465, partial [Clostridium sp.]|nr:hypothetical protein [Clostridium sp.]
ASSVSARIPSLTSCNDTELTLRVSFRPQPEPTPICHQEYDEDYVTYTVFGYDKNQKMQVTTGCCARTLTELVLLGVCGCFDPDERDEIMENHPMAKKFFSN